MTQHWSHSARAVRTALIVAMSILLGVLSQVLMAPGALAAADGGDARSSVVSVVSVAVGDQHSCALSTAGGVFCWGSNGYGQLGDGTTTNRYRPVDVVGLTSGVAQISAAGLTTCAVTTSGGVKCWGYGGLGQLGNGQKVNQSTPVQVLGLASGVTSVAVGPYSVCAATSAGGAKCWGFGRYGQLGNDTIRNSAKPIDVVGLGAGVTGLAVGAYHACALTSAGVSCWGQNAKGQLGTGARIHTTSTPTPIRRLGADVAAVSAGGASTCASLTSGAVYCWGYNVDSRLLVTNPADTVPLPTRVIGVAGTTSLSLAGNSRCALRQHQVSCWGDNLNGALGDGTTTPRGTPAAVVDLPGPVTQVSVGVYHSCAVKGAGKVFCWGHNDQGELGNGSRRDSLTPVRVIGLNGLSE